MLKKVQFENNIRLQHLVFGYKIFDKEYFHLNYFLTILAFTIYKSNYVSKQKTKTIDVYLLFKNEFQRKMEYITNLRTLDISYKICPFRDIIRGQRNVRYNVFLSRYHSRTIERLKQNVSFSSYHSRTKARLKQRGLFRDIIREQRNVWNNVFPSRDHSRTRERVIQRVPFEISFENKRTFDTTCSFKYIFQGQRNVWYNMSLSRYHSTTKDVWYNVSLSSYH
jgi:hypothetical protein